MPKDLAPSSTGLLLSGGVDSAVLLDQLLKRGLDVVPIYVRTGCVWDDCELAAIGQFLGAITDEGIEELIVLDMPLADLYADHWSISGTGVPDDSTADEAVFMPGRNPLLLLKPVLWCQMHGVGQLAIATLENNPFDDATPEFFAQFERMIQLATRDHVQIVRPFERHAKHQVMELGRDLLLELTFSCLAPCDGMHCGTCNKCAERRAGFRRIEAKDLTRYAADASNASACAAAFDGKTAVRAAPTRPAIARADS